MRRLVCVCDVRRQQSQVFSRHDPIMVKNILYFFTKCKLTFLKIAFLKTSGVDERKGGHDFNHKHMFGMFRFFKKSSFSDSNKGAKVLIRATQELTRM